MLHKYNTQLIEICLNKQGRLKNQMQYWLLKTEPEKWSWHQQVESGMKGVEWNGVRNFQAAKNLRNMKIGDKCFFYHTGKTKSIIGIVKVIKKLFWISQTKLKNLYLLLLKHYIP